jgi:hypothetical protein
MLQVQGRSDLFLRLEVIKKVLAVPTIITGIIWGIKAMICGMMVNSLIAYYINSYWSGSFIGYSLREQVRDLIPALIMAVGMSAVVFFIGLLLPLAPLPLLVIQLITGAVIIIGVCEISHFKDYLYIKKIVKDNFCTLMIHGRKNK